MYNIAQDLLDALRATPEVLETLLNGCTQEQALAARGGDEGWSIVEVVCHLRDAEEEALSRERLMRGTVHPVIVAYDQERWARERNYAEASLREALASFSSFRAQQRLNWHSSHLNSGNALDSTKSKAILLSAAIPSILFLMTRCILPRLQDN